MNDDIVWEAQKSIEYIISEVSERGWSNEIIQIDEFAHLRSDARFLDSQVVQVYENYFLPERHEFEWQILSEIANVIVNSPPATFVAGSVVGGVLGNAAYDLLKIMCTKAAHILLEKLGSESKARSESFIKLAEDADQVKNFFANTPKARIEEIEKATGIPRERIHPLMKLAGLKHYRRDNPCFWELP